MSLQVDGTKPLPDQERQLQLVEAFFVEVIDYASNANGNNDITTKPVSTIVAPIHLRQITSSADVSAVAAAAQSIVFDRSVLVGGNAQRVIGFRS